MIIPAILPERSDFAAKYRARRSQVVWTRLVADLETPVSAMLKLADGRPYSILLESVEGGAVRGRYSIIAIKPDVVWRSKGDRAEINRRVRFDRDAFEPDARPPLQSLRAFHDESRIDLPDELPPMAAGIFGQMAYDMVRQVENLPDDNPDRLDLTESVFMRPTIIAIFDTIKDSVTLVTPVYPTADLGADMAFDLACERLADAVADLTRGVNPAPARLSSPHPEPRSNMTVEDYHRMVERAKEYILAGDIFQVVPSQRFSIPFELPPFALYRALRRLNPSPFLFFIDLDGYALVGSSPEILVRVRDGIVTIRPIAGTRRRGATGQEDEQLAHELLNDPKELAEHLMLLDLGRNDVGRVSRIGSVHVTEKMAIEYYSHVMHIVSNVEGELAPQYDAIDALMAGFPAGTVSGAPKVRAMEIIDELEPERRGFYGGSTGYISAGGGLDTCIALRTGLIKDGVLYVQAGGGVVADSDPQAEYEESCNKAMALIKAAEEAVRFASGGR